MRTLFHLLAPFSLLLLPLLFVLPACDDDDAAPTVPVGISGQVIDAAGDPVAAAAVGLVYRFDGLDLPGDWDKGVIRPFDKPATQIQFVITAEGAVQMWVEDYAGNHVRTLIDGLLDAGQHTVVWDALDDAGERVPAGMYTYFLAADGQETASADLFLYLYENEEILLAPHAVTDAEGRFTVPGALIPVGATIPTVDEYGTVTGSASVSSDILVKAVIAGDPAPVAASLAVDWVPGERLGGLVLTLP